MSNLLFFNIFISLNHLIIVSSTYKAGLKVIAKNSKQLELTMTTRRQKCFSVSCDEVLL